MCIMDSGNNGEGRLGTMKYIYEYTEETSRKLYLGEQDYRFEIKIGKI